MQIYFQEYHPLYSVQYVQQYKMYNLKININNDPLYVYLKLYVRLSQSKCIYVGVHRLVVRVLARPDQVLPAVPVRYIQ